MKRIMFVRRAVVLFAAAFFVFSIPVLAAEVVVGFSGDLSGPNAARTKAMLVGAEAVFKDVNARGGVRGTTIKFLQTDDQFKADKTLANLKTLLTHQNLVALFQVGGAPNLEAILDTLKTERLPLVGAVTGADSLRAFHPYVFHLKASFGQELQGVAQQIRAVGYQDVAVIGIDLPIGREGMAIFEKALSVTPAKLTKTKVAQDLSDLDAAMQTVRAAHPQVTLVLSPSGQGVKIIKRLMDSGVTTQIYCLSIMSSQNLYAALGDKSRGIAITQTVPLPGSQQSVAREFQNLMSAAHIDNAGVDHMDGYLSARILVEALQRIKGPISRPALVASLEGMRSFDLGGYGISFSPTNHIGSAYVEITMVSKQGRLIH